MATMRKIYELAKEINVKPQDIIRFLNSSGFPAFKSELQPISGMIADFVYEKFTGKPAPKKEIKKPEPKPIPKPAPVVVAPPAAKPAAPAKPAAEDAKAMFKPEAAKPAQPVKPEFKAAEKLAAALAKKAEPKQQPKFHLVKQVTKPAPKPGLRRPEQMRFKHQPKPVIKPVEGELDTGEKKVIKITEVTTVAELSNKLKVSTSDLIKKIMGLGMLVTINAKLDKDTISVIAAEFGYEVDIISIFSEEVAQEEIEEEKGLVYEHRPPIVTVMGHVDHGKTSLLDAIRETNVAGGEAGQITQHIGAYKVKLPKGEIVFLDTPGHEAFTSMRARGAQITDIVVLVVAADDGPMPQTIEAINHAKEAKVPLIVAMNKMDKPEANPELVKQALSKYELIPEDWGGKTAYMPVSARKKTGIQELLDRILLESEMLELKASRQGRAKGVVLEARLDKGKGPVATVLVEKGTLRVGDSFVAGFHYGKIRAMMTDRGDRLAEAVPPTPVEIIGFDGVPSAGDIFLSVADDKAARAISGKRNELQREINIQKAKHITLESIYSEIQEGKLKDLKIILKGDVSGSIDAISEALEKLSTDVIKITIIHKGTGNISESDVMLAAASNAVIIGFGVAMNINVPDVAKREEVEVNLYKIIYEIIDAVKAAMEGMLEPVFIDVKVGRAEIKQVIKIPDGFIAGAMVTEGKLTRGGIAKLFRDGAAVGEGKIASLRRFKDDVKEVAAGYECGLSIDGVKEYKPGDIVELYVKEKVVKAKKAGN